MLSKTGEIRIRTELSEDRGIAFCDHPSLLPLERPADDRCSTALATAPDDSVHEIDELIRKAHGDLFTHPKMVPVWDWSSKQPHDPPCTAGAASEQKNQPSERVFEVSVELAGRLSNPAGVAA